MLMWVIALIFVIFQSNVVLNAANKLTKPVESCEQVNVNNTSGLVKVLDTQKNIPFSQENYKRMVIALSQANENIFAKYLWQRDNFRQGADFLEGAGNIFFYLSSALMAGSGIYYRGKLNSVQTAGMSCLVFHSFCLGLAKYCNRELIERGKKILIVLLSL